ncbi:HAD hydrolase [Dacryopinax primogenitus]|uniref:HAD hydrolase n=1 Tax=Dacryopinax primogenitus (strain DJM 731) TaxID=1858805 RepID=M5G746_DACPD|nr:HAD hydrolase [Dacryopinax primogenitus]EJU04030.1 HAD hydrolase [Dacryopinax primogenitus]
MNLLGQRWVRISHITSGLARGLQTQALKKSSLAFCFDVDGVLLHGHEAIPCAKKALRMVEGENSRGLKIPYILLTNGGGKPEAERARSLSEVLGVNISEHQLIQAHTILRPIAKKYGHEPVLILGGELDTCRKIAEGYGYTQPSLPIDYLATDSRIWPFYKLNDAENEIAKPHPPHPKFVLTVHDPRNWALEIQLLVDLLTHPTHPPPKIVFCNPDLLWRSDYPRSRFGQGAFRTALTAAYRASTGKKLEYEQFGKPTRATYEFAEGFLMDQAGIEVGEEMPRVYMVGDNPESDIAGANAHGWESILVNTGVYNSADDGPPVHWPTRMLDNVEQAVEWAIDREFAPLGEKLRERKKWDGVKSGALDHL